MTGVFVGGVTVAVALVAAVVVGFALGRFWRRDAIARNSSAHTRDDVQRTLDDAAVVPEISDDQPSYSLTLAERPRVVPESAELRDSDVHGTTEDGRMTTAGLLGLIVRNSDTAVAVVDQFRDVVLYNHLAV